MIERRASVFTEKLSMFMVSVAALGAFVVLVEPQIDITQYGVKFGTDFSADLKGAVITAILIGGWTAVKEYWLGSSAGGEKKADTVSRIAEAAAPQAAAAVAAAAGAPHAKAETMHEQVNVTEDKK